MQPILALSPRCSLFLSRTHALIHGLVLEQIKAKCLEIRSTTKSTAKAEDKKSKYEHSAVEYSVVGSHRKRIEWEKDEKLALAK